MDRRTLIEQLAQRRERVGLNGLQLAEQTGLTERTIRNALGPRGNPQLSSLLALVDALGLELQLVPKGFGAVAAAPEGAYRPVATRVGEATQAPSAPLAPLAPPTPGKG
ncbi:helix-turn-helix domain-containing protein [Xenophilus arseniciresistens]|uniref:Helix-turn-helix domain-containing protein n=1 Tax=Xenophilus arseniciresistens TaxID=1283306 RepID=A0AAE3N6P4_9BURK|nr:helix-turn-helix domain-containing protein [Xenophilus arseniciresistens]MDA7415878.1 helix-turn-helix domain-containing protein [Xenophilus arseniciresistens]